jgi:hypothetical protein
MGHPDPALNLLAAGAAAVETLIGAGIELRESDALVPLKENASGTITRLGGFLSGPVPLGLRLLGGGSTAARRTAAISTIAGSLLTRIAWIHAGRVSAHRSSGDRAG